VVVVVVVVVVVIIYGESKITTQAVLLYYSQTKVACMYHSVTTMRLAGPSAMYGLQW